MRRFAAILIAVLSMAATPIPLERPSPGSGDTKTEHQADPAQERQDASANKRGTESAPLIVPIAQPEGHEAIATKSEGEGHWYASPDWWVAGFTGALFLATGGLWVFTGLLWSATRILVGDEQTNVKKELRAYINIAEGGSQNWETDITVKNFGKTPAYGLTFWADAVLIERGKVPEFIMPNGAVPSAVIVVGPDGTFKITPHIRDIRTDKDWNKGPKVFAFGVITYRDAFESVDRTTEFFLSSSYNDRAFHHFGTRNNAT